jgi:hypothetical protein
MNQSYPHAKDRMQLPLPSLLAVASPGTAPMWMLGLVHSESELADPELLHTGVTAPGLKNRGLVHSESKLADPELPHTGVTVPGLKSGGYNLEGLPEGALIICTRGPT